MEKEWFDQLTDAQKAKLKAMDGEVTIDRLIAFCKEEKLPLPVKTYSSTVTAFPAFRLAGTSIRR